MFGQFTPNGLGLKNRFRSSWETAQTFFERTVEQLSVFVKQAAWLNTVPAKAKRPRRETKSDAMPHVEAGAHLLEVLFEVGPAKSSGMGGQVGIDEIDLVAWQRGQLPTALG